MQWAALSYTPASRGYSTEGLTGTKSQIKCLPSVTEDDCEASLRPRPNFSVVCLNRLRGGPLAMMLRLPYTHASQCGTCFQHAVEQATATERGGHSIHVDVDDIRLYLSLHDMAIIASERNTLQLMLISVQFM